MSSSILGILNLNNLSTSHKTMMFVLENLGFEIQKRDQFWSYINLGPIEARRGWIHGFLFIPKQFLKNTAIPRILNQVSQTVTLELNN